MSEPKTPATDHPLDDGFVGAGRPLGTFPSPISDEDARRAEEAWNDPAFYEFVKDDVGGVTAGYLPKSTVDPNRTLFPTTEELEALPRWARVAFAARCARRVLPLVKRFWESVPAHRLRALDEAVKSAEAASGTRVDTAAAHSAVRAAVEEVRTAFAFHLAHAPAYAAARAIRAATAACAIGRAGDEEIACDIGAAAESMFWATTIKTIGSLAAPARDFDRLCQLAEREKWTDDTPVPQSVFGPMWEGAPPEWWTDDILAGLPPEPTIEPNKSGNEQAAPVEDATQPK